MVQDEIKQTGGNGEPVNINYTVNTPQSGAGTASRSMLALSKPAMMGVGLMTLGTLGVGLFSMFRVPGLKEQIKDLEAEIDRLTLEIDTLSNENDRFEVLNAELNDTLQDLVEINGDLNETATKLEGQVDVLNTTVANLTDIKDDLTQEKDDLTKLNQELNQTQQLLEVELVRLEALNETWTTTNLELKNSTQILASELQDLEQTNALLVNTTTGLNESITELEGQNQRLDELVTDLKVVEEYFIATGVEATDTLEAVAQALNSSIDLGRENVFRALAAYYNDVIGQWKCRESTIWFDEAFFQQPAVPIFDASGIEALNEVLDEVDSRMLKLMCLDRANFQAFMVADEAPGQEFGAGLLSISYTQLKRAVQNYGDLAMAHYGFAPNQVGMVVTPAEWEAASFDCQNVTKYLWTA